MANILTFKFLRELQKKERASRELEKLDNDFYSQVSGYMEKKMGLDLKNNKDFAERRDLEHTKIIIGDILNRRERKVINLAVLNVRGTIMPKNILPEEKELFEKIKSAVTKYRSNLEFVFYENEEKKETAGENIKEDNIEKKKEKGEEDKKTEKNKLGETDSSKSVTKIKILGAVPEFVADDGESYGPFEEGEIVDIPQSAAAILINIKKAKKEK
ncbi:MAG: DNA replication complex GINS family protein [Candidatus Aenigmarchaeota archaeon]|nr:DNA replication complex GINS family protein [Candidatus Aenigmarchaeota archaeon]